MPGLDSTVGWASSQMGSMMTDAALAFEQERDRLFGLAYRMTSSVMDADDVVQESWVRFDRALGRGEDIENPAAFLTTVATRLSIDRLRSASKKRENYVGPWLPEPILTDRDPAHIVEIDESVRLGFLHVLDRLGPVDRAVFLLHDIFDFTYHEVSGVVGRTEANCRQIARRARERVRADRKPSPLASPSDRALLDAVLVAAFMGDHEALEAMLAADVTLVSDGGADVRAARNVITGPYRLARFIIGINNRNGSGYEWHPAWVNGGVAVAVTVDGVLDQVWEIEFADGLVQSVHAVSNPDKLTAPRAAWNALH